jgi:hypothetical protein
MPDPKRMKTVRTSYHIFSHHALNIMEDHGVNLPAEPAGITNSYTSFQNIADYGLTIISQIRAWASQQGSDTLDKVTSVKSNRNSRMERLDLVAGQLVHHLRQLYFILEHFGITPENRVDDSEWPPEYVLTILW